MNRGRGAQRLGGALSRSTLLWIAVAVVVLVVVDVVLVALALSRTAPQDAGQPGPIPTFTSTPAPSPTASASASAPAAEGASAIEGSPGRRLLAAVNGTEAWRASAGVCGGPAAVLQHTTDGGTTWKSVSLGSDVASVMGLRASSGSVSVLVGAGPDCEADVRTSTDDGGTWTSGKPGVAGAGIGPRGLVVKTGTVDPPCADPIEVYQGQFTTAVICADVLAWRSGAGKWVETPMKGVRSLADAGDHYTIARVGDADCAGVQITSLAAAKVTPSSIPAVVGCDAAAAVDGSVTVARSGEAVWLWAGDTVAVSPDGGVTW